MYYTKFCKTCKKDVHCCNQSKSGFIFLGITDAEKIKKHTKKSYKEIIDCTPLPKKTINLLKNDDPGLEGYLRYSQLKNNRLLRLKKKADGNCIFLDEKRRCSIYSVRPNICRIFPFWAMRLISNKIKIIEHDAYPECLIVKNKDVEKTLSKKQKEEIKSLFKKIEKEDIHYKKNITSFMKKLSQS
jgi:Fe-S-cluster containining protein